MRAMSLQRRSIDVVSRRDDVWGTGERSRPREKWVRESCQVLSANILAALEDISAVAAARPRWKGHPDKRAYAVGDAAAFCVVNSVRTELGRDAATARLGRTPPRLRSC